MSVPDDPRAPSFQPGERIGRYVIINTAGQGGMSVVYLAYDPQLDRKVAVKLMRLELLGEQGKQRLLREAQALARLSHPNVVPVYDVGTVGEQAFVAMEFVEGQTLKRWLKQPRTWREVVAVMRDAGRGLSAAHRAGLVHRDFKPDNVVIGNDGRVRVLDFGLARAVEDLDGSSSRTPVEKRAAQPGERGFEAHESSESGHRSLSQVTRADQVIGTPAYMAPEQTANGATDERADQFSFCVTLYEALFRVKPFENAETLGGSGMATVADKKGASPRPIAPAPARSDVPSWLQKVVLRGLAVDPVHRFPSMDELLRALENDPAGRRRRLAALVAAAAVAALVIAGGVVSRRHREALCRGGQARVQAVWSAARRDQVRRAFQALHLPYADAAAQAVGRALDAWADDWARMHDDACAATNLRREQSQEVLDLRMACLGDRLKELSALVAVVEHPDRDVAQEASHAAQSLTPVADCADIGALKGAQAPPRDADKRARAEELLERLAAVQAQEAVGKTQEAARLGDALAKDAGALGWLPLVADVHLWRGRAWADLGEEKSSIPAFRASFAAALAGRNDRALKQSAVRLAQEYIYKNDLDGYQAWAAVAQGAIDRAGPDVRMQNFLDHTRCVAMWQSGSTLGRLDCLRKHARAAERIDPLTEWELTTLGLAASDAGQFAEAIEYLKRGVEYSVKENGYTHPRTLEMRSYLCKGWLDEGDLDRAISECGEALKAAEELGVADYIKAKLQLYLGAGLRELGRYDEARKLLETSRAHVRPEGEALVELAQLASVTGQHAAALAYFKESLAQDEKDLAPNHPNLVIDLLQLGQALLAHGDVAEARKVLGRADGIVEHADLSPFMVADVRFALARALWPEPAERKRARALADQARATYATGPSTQKQERERARIAKFLSQPGQ